jgi:predicted nucleic acid-binding protein
VTPVYLESSAVLAWLLGEPQSRDIQTLIDSAPVVFSSPLTSAEVRRALARAAHDGHLSTADDRRLRALLQDAETGWASVEIDDDTWRRAGDPFPAEPLRTLDALHVAAALRIAAAAPDLRVMTFDRRVAAAARGLGVAVEP